MTDDAEEVFEETLLFNAVEELIEPTRGEEVPEEKACCGGGNGNAGNRSFTYDRCAAW